MIESYFNGISYDFFIENLKEIKKEQKKIKEIYKQIIPKKIITKKNLKKKFFLNYKRLNRKKNSVRNIEIIQNPLKMNSVIFKRGETKVLVFTDIFSNKNYYYDYNVTYRFNPFSVGENGETYGNSRREKGHSLLSQNSFKYIFFKSLSYRFISEVLSCNGSSSMATVCGISICLYQLYGEKLISGITSGIINKEIYIDLDSEEDGISKCDLKLVSNEEKKIFSIFMDSKQEISFEEIEKLLKANLNGNLFIIKEIKKKLKKNLYIDYVIIKKEKFMKIPFKNFLEVKTFFNCNIDYFDNGFIYFSTIIKKDLIKIKTFLDSFGSITSDKKMLCLIKEKKILNDKNIFVNLGGFNYIGKKFKYNIGDLISFKIDNSNNKTNNLKLKNIKIHKIKKNI